MCSICASWGDLGLKPKYFPVVLTLDECLLFRVGEMFFKEYAIEKSNLKFFIESLDKGIDTTVGELGNKISGGQKQRIGIARALYNNPSLLIFDEATSALDIDTEAEIMNTIFKFQKSKTIIIIAHRLSTVKKCDLIYKINKGKIESFGSPEKFI